MATTQNICFDVLKHFTSRQLKQVTSVFIIENRSLFEHFFLAPSNKSPGFQTSKTIRESTKEMKGDSFPCL